jgi:hypothetical protein
MLKTKIGYKTKHKIHFLNGKKYQTSILDYVKYYPGLKCNPNRIIKP